jgi:guanylate kinase
VAERSITIARHPFIIVISGPSGVGKSTIVKRVLDHHGETRPSVSMTTRAPRGDERDGVDYYFVSENDFIRKRDAGELLECAAVHGHLYGTPAGYVDEQLGNGRNVLLEIDVQGGLIVKKKRPGAALVFLLPPSLEELERRLRGRGTDDEEVVRRRLENARRELAYYDRYDYLVVNEDVPPCAEDVLNIIRAVSLEREKCIVTIADSTSGHHS